MFATLWLLLWVGTAIAQDLPGNVDAHGLIPPPSAGELSDPVLGWRPMLTAPGSWSASGLLDIADDPLVQFEQLGPGPPQRIAVLDSVAALQLGGSWSVSRRTSLAAALPLFLFSTGSVGDQGPALGDLSLYAPLGLRLPSAEGQGLGLSLIPKLVLPSGANARFLGQQGVGLGLTAAAGLGLGRLSLGANLGLDLRRSQQFANQSLGGAALLTTGDLGVRLNNSLALHLEGRASAALDPAGVVRTGPTPDQGDAQRTGSPAELLLALRARGRRGAWGWGGLARGVSAGVGSARVRGLVGAGYTHTGAGADGSALAPWVLHVTDPAGAPVAGAVVHNADKELGRTDVSGLFQAEVLRWRKGLIVGAPSHTTVSVSPPDDPDLRRLEVQLGWTPVVVQVRAKDPDGAPLIATILASSEGLDSLSADAQGGLSLQPGSWRIAVSAEGFGSQTRSLQITPGEAPNQVELILQPVAGEQSLVLQVDDPDGNGVGGAQVLLDGLPLGATTDGGGVEVAGLAAGPHRVEIAADAFTQTSIELVLPGPGQHIVLKRLPGTVRVHVIGPDGVRVSDAVARFDGPARLAPTPLGRDGTRYFGPLRPGSWQLSVLSPTYGIQLREVVVPADAWQLIEVEVVLQPGEHGGAQLTVQVMDLDGEPISGAELLLDDKPLGTTATGGSLTLQGLEPGPRSLLVRAEHHRPQPVSELMLVEGIQEQLVILPWVAGATQVRVRSATGPVDDAVVRFAGPSDRSVPLGPQGEAFLQLAPGDWTLLVTSAAHGLQQRDLKIAVDSQILHRVDVRMGAEAGDAELALSVRDPEGSGVGSAQVWLDDTPLGATTPDGRLRTASLSTGRRRLEVQAPHHGSWTGSLSLARGRTDHTVTLPWAPGTVRVRTHDAAGPVTDAVVRFIGPSAVSPAPVDAQGERLFTLSPGSWQALVISESYGISQHPLALAEGSDLHTLDITLRPIEAGTAELLVRVQDADGRPIPGASVQAAKLQVRSGQGGVALLAGLAPGQVTLSISAPNYRPLHLSRVELVEGSQERIVVLDYEDGAVRVTVSDASGAPVDASVHFVGPEELPDARVGSDGSEVFTLRPGRWELVASTASLGPKRVAVEVRAGAELQQLSLQLEAGSVRFNSGAVELKKQVPFAFDQATLEPAAGPILDEVANTLLAHPEIIKVEVQGHADAKGTATHNQRLSQARAEAVRSALVGRGVAPEVLVARGYGTTRPLVSNDSEEGRAKNRRVQFKILESRK